jgi:hypothetical protein
MSREATLKCVPAGISMPEERVRGLRAMRLKDTWGNVSLGDRCDERKGRTESRWGKALGFFEEAVHFAELVVCVSLPTATFLEDLFDFLA